MVVKRVGPLSLAKMTGLLYAILGFVFGCFMAFASMLGAMAGGPSEGPVFGLIFGVGAVIFLPILYGGIGFVMSLVMAGLYNLLAGLIGGIEIQLDQEGAGPAHIG